MKIKSLLKCAKLRVYVPFLEIKMSLTQKNMMCTSGRHLAITSFDNYALMFNRLIDKYLMQTNNFYLRMVILLIHFQSTKVISIMISMLLNFI